MFTKSSSSIFNARASKILFLTSEIRVSGSLDWSLVENITNESREHRHPREEGTWQTAGWRQRRKTDNAAKRTEKARKHDRTKAWTENKERQKTAKEIGHHKRNTNRANDRERRREHKGRSPTNAITRASSIHLMTSRQNEKLCKMKAILGRKQEHKVQSE